GPVEGVLRRERGVLRRPGLARWCGQDGCDREGPPAHRGAAPAGTRGV
ncbi:MAG: 4Fe-4S ferredoxin, iron-sulfur binding, partial [uncultured Nocardioidaceae bacterium]